MKTEIISLKFCSTKLNHNFLYSRGVSFVRTDRHNDGVILIGFLQGCEGASNILFKNPITFHSYLVYLMTLSQLHVLYKSWPPFQLVMEALSPVIKVVEV
jgi:hypothetical protein